jgi:CheY-like chemotaxis protein
MAQGRILIVEDEFLIAKNTQFTLEGMGYSILGIAMTGSEAIGMTRELKPDVLLVDIVLPGEIDGIEAVEELQKSLDIPVVFLSGNLEGINMKRIEKVRHFGCLSKPCNDYDLKKFIEYALSDIGGN